MKTSYEKGTTPEFRNESDLEIINGIVDNPAAKVQEMMSRDGNTNAWGSCINTLFNAIKVHTSFMVTEDKVTVAYENRVARTIRELQPQICELIERYPVPHTPDEVVQKAIFEAVSSLKPTQEELI